MIAPRAHIAAMAPYALADLTPPPGKRLISLAQNESLLPPSPLAIEAATAALKEAALYPDPDWTRLRAAIAEVHDLEPAQILCGSGSMELILCLAQCFAGPGEEVLSSRYAYAFFRTAAKIAQADYVAAAEENLTVSVDRVLEAVSEKTRIVFLANPGNPTGTRIETSELRRLRDDLPDDVLLVIDEAYGEFADASDDAAFSLVERGSCVVLRTFSKAYGLAGLRVGWGYFPPAVAAELRKLLNPNNVSAASQAAAAAAMTDQAYMRQTVSVTAGLRDRFASRLRGLGLEVPPSATNFALIRFPSAGAARKADAALKAEGLFLRAMAGYGLNDCLRATIGPEPAMGLALDVLSKLHAMEER